VKPNAVFGAPSGITCSTPLLHDGQVFAASAYNAGGGLVKLAKGGDTGVKAEEMYFTKKMENHHGSMILHDGCLYGANGGNNGGNLICLDFKTGKVNWDAPTSQNASITQEFQAYYHFTPTLQGERIAARISKELR